MTNGESKQMLATMGEIKKLKTAEALRQIYELAKEQYEYARNKEANAMGWFIGQKVQLKSHLNNKKPYDAIGIVQKINPKKLIVRVGMENWTIPKTMLQSATM